MIKLNISAINIIRANLKGQFFFQTLSILGNVRSMEGFFSSNTLNFRKWNGHII